MYGDNSATSTAGFTDPFAAAVVGESDEPHVKRKRRKTFAEEEPGDEILWDESMV